MSRSTDRPLGCPSPDVLLRLVYLELDTDVARFVEAHVSECARCRSERDDIARVRAAYAALPDPRASRGLEALVAEATTEAPPAPRRATAWPAKRPGRGRWLAVAAVATVAFAAGTAVSRGGPAAGPQAAEAYRWRVQAVRASLESPSAATRLQAVGDAGEMGPGDADLTAALIQTLRGDPSPNVRLEAVAALAGVPLDERGRTLVAAALRSEPWPALRIALIDLIGEKWPEESAEVLREVARGDEDPAVRARAISALERTS